MVRDAVMLLGRNKINKFLHQRVGREVREGEAHGDKNRETRSG
jgi:hypothetical protein